MKKAIIAIVLAVLVGGVLMSGCWTRRNEYDFRNDTVIIILTQEAIDSGRIPTIEDFPEIELVGVRYLGFGTYVLTLKRPSHRNVLRAVELLSQRGDIELASPNYIETGA